MRDGHSITKSALRIVKHTALDGPRAGIEPALETGFENRISAGGVHDGEKYDLNDTFAVPTVVKW